MKQVEDQTVEQHGYESLLNFCEGKKLAKSFLRKKQVGFVDKR